MSNQITDDEIIDKILSWAKEKEGESIQVQYFMKNSLGIRDPKIIKRIFQRMQAENIGGNILAGGAFIWNENAHIISDEGYLNYKKKKELKKSQEDEYKKLVYENEKLKLQLNKKEVKFKEIHFYIIIASFIISIISLIISFSK